MYMFFFLDIVHFVDSIQSSALDTICMYVYIYMISVLALPKMPSIQSVCTYTYRCICVLALQNGLYTIYLCCHFARHGFWSAHLDPQSYSSVHIYIFVYIHMCLALQNGLYTNLPALPFRATWLASWLWSAHLDPSFFWDRNRAAAHTCVGLYIYACMYIYIYIYMCIYMYVCICMYKHVYIHIYTCIYVYTYAYVYIYTHIYTSSFPDRNCATTRTCTCGQGEGVSVRVFSRAWGGVHGY